MENEEMGYDNEEIFLDFSFLDTESDWIKMYFHLQHVSYANGKCMSPLDWKFTALCSFVNRNSWKKELKWEREKLENL